MKNSEKGITLIALIITIIVLLILAGVTIALVIGDNGILSRAKDAKNTTDAAQKQENTTLEQYNTEINKYISNGGSSETIPANTALSTLQSNGKMDLLREKRVTINQDEYTVLYCKQDGTVVMACDNSMGTINIGSNYNSNVPAGINTTESIIDNMAAPDDEESIASSRRSISAEDVNIAVSEGINRDSRTDSQVYPLLNKVFSGSYYLTGSNFGFANYTGYHYVDGTGRIISAVTNNSDPNDTQVTVVENLQLNVIGVLEINPNVTIIESGDGTSNNPYVFAHAQ